MIPLQFKAAGGATAAKLTGLIVFRGGELFCGPVSEIPVARYVAPCWVFNGVAFASIECRSFLTFQFEGADRQDPWVVGPRPSMRIRGGFVFAGREHLATLNSPAGLWRARRGKQSWPVLRVQPAI